MAQQLLKIENRIEKSPAYPQIQIAFKNCAAFTKYTAKIDGTTVDMLKNIDVVMPMYNVIERSSNDSKTTAILWFCSKYEESSSDKNTANTDNFTCFKYKAKLMENRVSQPAPNAANGI